MSHDIALEAGAGFAAGAPRQRSRLWPHDFSVVGGAQERSVCRHDIESVSRCQRHWRRSGAAGARARCPSVDCRLARASAAVRALAKRPAAAAVVADILGRLAGPLGLALGLGLAAPDSLGGRGLGRVKVRARRVALGIAAAGAVVPVSASGRKRAAGWAGVGKEGASRYKDRVAVLPAVPRAGALSVKVGRFHLVTLITQHRIILTHSVAVEAEASNPAGPAVAAAAWADRDDPICGCGFCPVAAISREPAVAAGLGGGEGNCGTHTHDRLVVCLRGGQSCRALLGRAELLPRAARASVVVPSN